MSRYLFHVCCCRSPRWLSPPGIRVLMWIGLTCVTIRQSQTWGEVASEAGQKRPWGFHFALFWVTCVGESHHRRRGHSGSFLERSTWWATEASCQQPALTWQRVAEITRKWPFSPRQPSDAQRWLVSWLWPQETPWARTKSLLDSDPQKLCVIIKVHCSKLLIFDVWQACLTK